MRDFLRNLSGRAARICVRLANRKQPNGAIRGPERLERAITGAFCDLRTAGQRQIRPRLTRVHRGSSVERALRRLQLKLHAARLIRVCREIRLDHHRHCLRRRSPCLSRPGERRQSQDHRLRYLNVWRPAPEDKTVNHLFPLGFKYRHRAGNFDSSGYVVAENTGGEIRLEIRLGCGVDCEGGRR